MEIRYPLMTACLGFSVAFASMAWGQEGQEKDPPKKKKTQRSTPNVRHRRSVNIPPHYSQAICGKLFQLKDDDGIEAWIGTPSTQKRIDRDRAAGRLAAEDFVGAEKGYYPRKLGLTPRVVSEKGKKLSDVALKQWLRLWVVRDRYNNVYIDGFEELKGKPDKCYRKKPDAS